MGARSKRIHFRTSVLLVPLYDPMKLAEDAAVTQLATGGRLILGIGARQVVTLLVTRNVWSVGDRSRPDVNELSLTYFLFYNLPKFFYLLYEPVITADWTAQPGDRWTLPVGLGFGRNFPIPRRPRLWMSTRLTGSYNAVRTDRDPKWQLLFVLNFIRPNPAVFTSLSGVPPG